MDMTAVRAGDAVWLPKENRKAWLNTAWIPPRPGHCAGEIGVDGKIWFVDVDGNGFDGLALIAPLEGETYDPQRPLPHNELLQINSMLAILFRDRNMMCQVLGLLESRIQDLESRLAGVAALTGVIDETD